MARKLKKQKRSLKKNNSFQSTFSEPSPFANIKVRSDDFFSPEIGELGSLDSFELKKVMPSTGRLTWLIGLALFLISLTFAYRELVKMGSEVDLVTTHFEIKVIDTNGYPVAGAKVIIDKQNLGTTDTFGEWRSYLPLKTKNPHELKLEKDLSNRVALRATKNILIKQTGTNGMPLYQETIEVQGYRKPKVRRTKSVATQGRQPQQATKN